MSSMGTPFEEALLLDERGKIIEMIDAYDEIIARSEATKDVYVNLIFLYATLFDWGVAAANGVTSRQMRSYAVRYFPMIAEVLRQTERDPDIVALWLYTQWFIGVTDHAVIERQMYQLMAGTDTLYPYLFLHGTENTRVKRGPNFEGARLLVASLGDDQSQRSLWVRDVLKVDQPPLPDR